MLSAAKPSFPQRSNSPHSAPRRPSPVAAGVQSSSRPPSASTPAYAASTARSSSRCAFFSFDGSLLARFEYDAYGSPLVAAETYAAAMPLRFSSKWFDAETGLGYWGYRWYHTRQGRWMSRDPIGEYGSYLRRRNIRDDVGHLFQSRHRRSIGSLAEPNHYTFVSNQPLRKVDTLGLCGCDKDDCNRKLKLALADSRIKKMIEDAKTLKHWHGVPCFGRVRCTCNCAEGVLGWASPFTGNALVCAKASSGMDQGLFNDVVREEIAHQMLMCGNINNWLWSCSGCMAEEKRAKYLAGLCKTDKECTREAWTTCGSHGGCKGKAAEDFEGVGWPPDLEGHEPY